MRKRQHQAQPYQALQCFVNAYQSTRRRERKNTLNETNKQENETKSEWLSVRVKEQTVSLKVKLKYLYDLYMI